MVKNKAVVFFFFRGKIGNLLCVKDSSLEEQLKEEAAEYFHSIICVFLRLIYFPAVHVMFNVVTTCL